MGRVVERAACRCTGASLTCGENIEGVDDLDGALVESREVGCCICELERRQISADTTLELAKLFTIGLGPGTSLVGAVGPVDGGAAWSSSIVRGTSRNFRLRLSALLLSFLRFWSNLNGWSASYNQGLQTWPYSIIRSSALSISLLLY